MIIKVIEAIMVLYTNNLPPKRGLTSEGSIPVLQAYVGLKTPLTLSQEPPPPLTPSQTSGFKRWRGWVVLELRGGGAPGKGSGGGVRRTPEGDVH